MFFKKLATVVLIWHVVFTVFFPFTVYAEDGDSTPTPTPVIESSESPSPTSAPDPTPTVTPSDDPTPAPTEPAPTASADPSPTPTETQTPETESLTLPVPEATDPAPLATSESTEPPQLALTADDTTQSEPGQTTSTQQTASTESSTTSESDSGGNTQQGSGTATMTTGDVVAVADSVTVANLSEVNSNLITVVETILTADGEDINLYQALMNAISQNPNFVPGNSDIFVDQNAQVVAQTSALANSGDNSQAASESTMTTGEAVALANSITAANLNLVGSNVILAIINILVDYDGNIILPNYEQISLANGELGPDINVSVNQNSINSSETTAISVSGENNQTLSASAELTTGNSISISNSETLSNIVQIGGGMGLLFLNNLGGWTGQLVNWNLPGESLTFDPGSYSLSRFFLGGNFSGNGRTNIFANQTADVSTSTNASSVSGGNNQEGGVGIMTTGSSTAVSNSLTLSNITSVGGNLLIGIINIVGKWGGNIVTPYPNLELSVTDNKDIVKPGETNEYILTVKNTGDAIAHDVNLRFSWPEKVIPIDLADSEWGMGDLNPGVIQTFRFRGQIAGDLGNGTVLLARALATTSDTQETAEGSSAEDQTKVDIPNDASPDTRTPDLRVSVWNNTGEFVLPGDTVLVKITLENKSPFVARNVNVKSQITNEHPIEFPAMDYALGDIRANGKVTISFSLTLNKETLPALYHITSQASGQSDSGDMGYSNSSVSNFLVKGLNGSLPQIVPPVLAEVNYPGVSSQVLGTAIEEGESGPLDQTIIRFLPLFAFLAAAIYVTRRKFAHHLRKNS
jgi:hypothetical protein